MPDLLVNLLKLPSPDSAMVQMEKAGILIRRAHPFEITLVRSFVEEHFSVA